MFERFTDKGRKIIILAREEAERHQNDYLGTEHLVLAILRESDGIALMILKKMGLSTEQIRLEIERNLPGGGTTMTFGEIPFSPRVKKVIEYGVEEARLLGHNHIGSEHLLLGLLREEEGIGGKILRSLGANLLTARQLTVTFLRKSAPRERDRKSNMIPRFGWPLTDLPLWLLIAAGVVWLASFAVHSYMRGKWLEQLAGHGFQWMRSLAWYRPYYARLETLRAMKRLGYQGEEDA
jgi:ATP-dependent Clp protease ATP-binding subunit ClpC